MKKLLEHIGIIAILVFGYNVTIIFLLFVCNVHIFSQPDSVKGGFKQCIGYEYKYKFGELDKKSKTKVSSTLYNTKGNKIESIIYRTDSSIHLKSSYIYDASGNQTERVDYNSDSFILFK
jgi:hypothetical protein